MDISNPTDVMLRLSVSVQGFRQINDEGQLEFFTDKRLEEGIVPDYTAFDLAAMQTMRMYFLADGAKLPEGNVFAVIFFDARTDAKSQIAQHVRIGTLVSLVNGTPSKNRVSVSGLSVPLFQFGNTISASFDVKNEAVSPESGMYPDVRVEVWPFYDEAVTGPLVFSGRERQVAYSKEGNYAGIARITIAHGRSSETKYSVIVTGIWRWVLGAAGVIGILVMVYWMMNRRPRVKPLR